MPAANVPTTLPSLARIFVTVLSAWFDDQMLAPSKVTPYGSPPTLNVPSTAPSFALTFVTLLPL
jgi:hypothetical protein